MSRQPTPNLLDADADVLGTVLGSSRKLQLSAIRLDGGTQPRAALNLSHITDLIADLDNGAMLPPIDVMYDGATYWLFDGYHRVHAVRQARGDDALIDARVHQGSQQDAQWASYAANKAHGLRRTTEDKQRAIVAALRHPNGASRSNREIARHLGVDDTTVGEWRKKLESGAGIPQVTERTGADGKTYNTANIGAKPPKPAAPPYERPAAQPQVRRYESGLPALNMPMPAAPQPAAVPADDRPLPAWVTDDPEPEAPADEPEPEAEAEEPLVRQSAGLTPEQEREFLRHYFDLDGLIPAINPIGAMEWRMKSHSGYVGAPWRWETDGKAILVWHESNGKYWQRPADARYTHAKAKFLAIRLLETMQRASDPEAPAPAATPTDDKVGRIVRLIGIYRMAIRTFDEYGDLIGAHMETLPAKRELDKLIAHLEREAALLEGRKAPDAWQVEEAWL